VSATRRGPGNALPPWITTELSGLKIMGRDLTPAGVVYATRRARGSRSPLTPQPKFQRYCRISASLRTEHVGLLVQREGQAGGRRLDRCYARGLGNAIRRNRTLDGRDRSPETASKVRTSRLSRRCTGKRFIAHSKASRLPEEPVVIRVILANGYSHLLAGDPPVKHPWYSFYFPSARLNSVTRTPIAANTSSD
jgi:hypothetical protein